MEDYNHFGLMYWLSGDDSTIASKRVFVEKYLPPEMRRIKGFKQHKSHGGLDPVEHTFKVLYDELDRRGLSPRDSVALTIATFYHDCGKEDVDDCDPEHPIRSGRIWLAEAAPNSGLEEGLTIDVAGLVANHIALANYVGGNITADECLALFRNERRLLDMHHRMITADIRAKPAFGQNGGSSFLEKINAAYEALREKTIVF